MRYITLEVPLGPLPLGGRRKSHDPRRAGFRYAVIRLMEPPLPAASRPSKISTTRVPVSLIHSCSFTISACKRKSSSPDLVLQLGCLLALGHGLSVLVNVTAAPAHRAKPLSRHRFPGYQPFGRDARPDLRYSTIGHIGGRLFAVPDVVGESDQRLSNVVSGPAPGGTQRTYAATDRVDRPGQGQFCAAGRVHARLQHLGGRRRAFCGDDGAASVQRPGRAVADADLLPGFRNARRLRHPSSMACDDQPRERMLYLYIGLDGRLPGLHHAARSISHRAFERHPFAKNGYWYPLRDGAVLRHRRLLRNQPAWVVVAVALIPNIARPLTDQFFEGLVPGALYTSMAMNLGFFLIGAYFKDLFGHSGCPRDLGPTPLCWGWWQSSAASSGSTPRPRSARPTCTSLICGIRYQPGGADHPQRRTSLGGYAGARTLPIYVWQARAVRGRRVPPGLCGVHPGAQLLFPLLFTAGVAGSALVLHRWPAMKHLFHAPGWTTSPQDL